jgi:hypothetical protein
MTRDHHKRETQTPNQQRKELAVNQY